MKSFKLEMNIDDFLERLWIQKHKWIFESRRKKEKGEIPYLTEEVLIIEGTASICLDSLLTQSSFIIIVIIIRSEMIVLMWYCLLNGVNLPTMYIKIEDRSHICIRT